MENVDEALAGTDSKSRIIFCLVYLGLKVKQKNSVHSKTTDVGFKQKATCPTHIN